MVRQAFPAEKRREMEQRLQKLLSAAGQIHDWTDRKYILPLLEYLR